MRSGPQSVAVRRIPVVLDGADVAQLVRDVIADLVDGLGGVPINVEKQMDYDDNWANLGAVGSNLSRLASDFDSRTWGFAKLKDLFAAHPDYVVQKKPNGVLVQPK